MSVPHTNLVLTTRGENTEHYGAVDLPPIEKEDARFPSEWCKTLLALVFYFLVIVWAMFVLAFVHERVPDRTRSTPLPDLFFDLFDPVDEALEAAEYILVACEGILLVLIVFHKHRSIILRRCFIIRGILYFMRSFTMLVTQLPVPSTTYFCSPKANTTSPLVIAGRAVSMLSGFGLSINGNQSSMSFCGDYIYSGHTIILVMAFLLVREYTPRRFYLLHGAVWLSSCVGVFLVLLSRGHYSVDVLLAYYFTTRVFWMYHTIANSPLLKVPDDHNYLSRCWWFRIFSYFEKNVGGVVPNQYEWPSCCAFEAIKKRARHLFNNKTVS